SGVFLESKLKNVQNPQIKLTSLLNELLIPLAKSKLPIAKVLASQIKELLSSEPLKEVSNNKMALHVKDNPKVLENTARSVQNIVDKFTTELKRANPITTKEFEAKLTKLEHIIQPKNLEKENFTLLTLQDSLKQVTQTLQTSFTKESKGFLDALNKIFQSLKSIEQSQIPQKAVLEQIVVDKKIPTEIKNIIENIKSSIQNSDSLFSKPVKAIVNELTLLKSPRKLSSGQNIKELLSNDLKAVLHKTSDEMSKSTIPSHVEAAKQMDKLSLQIDYYQLVSHLSNSSSLYIPFSWEDMQEGNITIKKAQDDRFYCDIDLKLKEYGELKLRLVMYEKNQLNIHINSDNDEFKNIIKENIPSLRKALIDIQITPREIRFLNNTKNSTITYDSDIRDLDVGFEVKV
ncbi:MAG: flagellar hook-length control protein FliK, partial [Sulfurimonas sp.]|nr:flagellar hook-length control protein FliK [Sulfurimonas sp.]